MLGEEKKLFQLWYQMRDGTLTREAFRQAVQPIRVAIYRELQAGASYDIGAQSQAGSEFVSRMLTVVTSLHTQQRDVLEFLTPGVEFHPPRQQIITCLEPTNR